MFHTLRILRVIYATLPELSVAEKVFAEGKGKVSIFTLRADLVITRRIMN